MKPSLATWLGLSALAAGSVLLPGCRTLLRDFEEEAFSRARDHFKAFRFGASNRTLATLAVSPKAHWRKAACAHFVSVSPLADAAARSVLVASLRYADTAPYALHALARLGWEEAGGRIVKGLEGERSPERVAEYLRGLASTGLDRYVAAALPRVHAHHHEVRVAALDVLSRTRGGGPEAIAALRRRLDDPGEARYLRLLAAKGLATRSDGSGFALALGTIRDVPLPRVKTGDPGLDEDLVAMAVICLGLTRKAQAVAPLRALRRSAGPRLRVFVDGALALLGEEGAFDRVAGALSHRGLRSSAIPVMGLLGGDRSKGLLQDLVRHLARGRLKDLPAATDFQAAAAVLRRRWPEDVDVLVKLMPAA